MRIIGSVRRGDVAVGVFGDACRQSRLATFQGWKLEVCAVRGKRDHLIAAPSLQYVYIFVKQSAVQYSLVTFSRLDSFYIKINVWQEARFPTLEAT